METITLGKIAHARSGDKGNHANIGVVAYTAAGFEFLRRELTADRDWLSISSAWGRLASIDTNCRRSGR